MATVGSSGGVDALRSGVVDIATAHLLDPARHMAGAPKKSAPTPADFVVVELFYRELGLLVSRGNPKSIRSVRDLARSKLRFINRQPGSGTRIYLDQELARARVNSKKIVGYEAEVSTHLQVGLRILKGEADCGLGTRTTALWRGLDFCPLVRERFDMLIKKERFFTPGIQTLVGILGSRQYRERIDALGGYDAAESGRIIALN